VAAEGETPEGVFGKVVVVCCGPAGAWGRNFTCNMDLHAGQAKVFTAKLAEFFT
jgi:hypothetical protein